MRYYKQIADGYIQYIGQGNGGEEITAAEYENILAVIQAMPEAPEGKGYRLKTDLTYEEYDLPPVEESEEISAEEAVNIILEGNTL